MLLFTCKCHQYRKKECLSQATNSEILTKHLLPFRKFEISVPGAYSRTCGITDHNLFNSPADLLLFCLIYVLQQD